ncbi:hypothetical protein B0H10DRAFT_1905153 [Mycena sp. CBHHK59/15]|nr:hypothetical protein B0H10DRAFT_1905153 [Mycena sp. CBHHK59/15]
MPSLPIAKASNATFSPTYLPIAVFVGGTSGVGQGIVEAFARYVHGRAHIIIVGRNEHAAEEIIEGLPKPADVDGWRHEFLHCDVTLMSNVRAACTTIQQKVGRLNFLILTAGYASMAHVAQTSEGLDLHLSMRYYQRYVFTKELLPLLTAARQRGEDARVMSVLGAGRGSPERPIDLDNLGNTKNRTGRIGTAMRSIVASSGYTDAMMAHFAARNPEIAFTHIHPGVVRTSFRADFDGLLTPLSWLINFILPFIAISQNECAEYMLYALFTGERGIFICSKTGDVISAHAFDAPLQQLDEGSSTAHTTGVLNGVQLKGYGASDVGVVRIIQHTEEVTRAG